MRPAVEAIARTLARTPGGEAVAWDIEIDDGVGVAVDADDLNDILGNLMENAARVGARPGPHRRRDEVASAY